MINKVNSVINEHIRPLLAQHNGDIKVVSIEDDVVLVEFLGQCSGCLSAQHTMETVVKDILLEKIPTIKEVKLQVKTNEDLLAIGKNFMKNKENNKSIDIKELSKGNN